MGGQFAPSASGLSKVQAVGSHPHGASTVTSRLGRAVACRIPTGLILSMAAYVDLPYLKHKSAFGSAVQVRQRETALNIPELGSRFSGFILSSLSESVSKYIPLRGHQLVAVNEFLSALLDFFPSGTHAA